MKFKLKDGRVVDIVPLTEKISVKTLLRYINDLMKEDVYLLYDKPFTYVQEKKWKDDNLKAMKRGERLNLCAIYKNRMVAGSNATKGIGRSKDNVMVGIGVAKYFRGQRLGEAMLRMTIKQARKKFKPKNIYLTVAAENKPALSLYRKIGFTKMIGRYPKWLKYKGRYIDELVLLLVNR